MDPAISAAIKAVSMVKAYLDAEALRQQIQDIQDTIEGLGKRIEEVLLIDLRSAYAHLQAASRATNDDFRRDELNNARTSFVRMANRPTTPVVPGTLTGGDGLSGDEIAAIGHAGSYSYLVLRGEPTLALIEAYRCTERFPALGVQLFPVGIFSRDYRATGEAMARRERNRAAIRAGHRQATTLHQRSRAEYYREMAWKVPLAAGAFLGSIALGAIAPSQAGLAPMRAAGILAGTGDRSVLDVPGRRPRLDLGADGIDPPAEVALMRQASAESRSRRLALEAS